MSRCKHLSQGLKVGYMSLNTGKTYFKKGYSPWNKGLNKVTDERIKKYSVKLIGIPCSNEKRRKIREKLRKGKYNNCKICDKEFWVRPSDCGRKYCSVKCMGIGGRGKKISEWHKKILSALKTGEGNPMYGRVGRLSPNWKEGRVRDPRQRARHSKKYGDWRLGVFKRDNYTCQNCGIRGGYLEAHHIKSWTQYKSLRYKIINGLSLCLKCHQLTKKGRNTKQL